MGGDEMTDFISRISKGYLLFDLVLLATGIFIAYQFVFTQDDAMISFRYAENLVEGHGLAWQPGEFVQGYTNLLWVLLMASVLWLGIPMEAASVVLGLVFFAGQILLFRVLCRQVIVTKTVGMFLSVLLITNFSVVSYATGGLETGLMAFLYLAALNLFVRILVYHERSPIVAVFTSIVFGLLFLTRLDSALFTMVMGLTILFRLVQRKEPIVANLPFLLALSLPLVFIVFGYLNWSFMVYEDWLPNTFYAKSSGASLWKIKNGVYYLYTFLTQYSFTVPCFLAVLFSLWKGQIFFVALSLYLLIWFTYVIYVGGDFMEFRFLVQLVPIILLLLGHLCDGFGEDIDIGLRWISIGGAAVVLVLSSALHGYTYRGPHIIESISGLDANISDPMIDWDGIGRELRSIFPGSYESGPMIAVTPAGAIPFYSKLPTLDMHGLNDRYIAKNIPPLEYARIAHEKLAPFDYIIERGVDLVIGHPFILTNKAKDPFKLCPSDINFRVSQDEMKSAVMSAARVVVAQYGAGQEVAMIALTRHEAVQDAIISGSLRVVRTGFHECTVPG